MPPDLTWDSHFSVELFVATCVSYRVTYVVSSAVCWLSSFSHAPHHHCHHHCHHHRHCHHHLHHYGRLTIVYWRWSYTREHTQHARKHTNTGARSLTFLNTHTHTHTHTHERGSNYHLLITRQSRTRTKVRRKANDQGGNDVRRNFRRLPCAEMWRDNWEGGKIIYIDLPLWCHTRVVSKVRWTNWICKSFDGLIKVWLGNSQEMARDVAKIQLHCR